MAKKYDLDEEEAKNWRLAKIFDLRSFIGVLFVIFGVLVTVSGFTARNCRTHRSKCAVRVVTAGDRRASIVVALQS